ncbi:hypothetical protein HNY73_004731 [Argiope bruennichi]|uniref:Uncharacterized protein n=1 Tax=Argiope bruennichi TaxID=94029 RepID=A0A8T0FQ41_ARGBR|nr:hypothetical protein HNY73_004731 [Argiope bruennichi]
MEINAWQTLIFKYFLSRLWHELRLLILCPFSFRVLLRLKDSPFQNTFRLENGRKHSLPRCNGFLADKGVVSRGDPPNESGEANDPVGALTASPRRSSKPPAGYESTFLLPHEEFCGLSVGAPVFNCSE